MVQLILSSTRNKGFSPNPQRFYFFRAYPDGHFGLVPVTFLDNFPFTQVIVLVTTFLIVVVVVGGNVVVVVVVEVVVVVVTASA